MNKYIIGGIAVLALILSVIGLVGGHQSVQNLGAIGTRYPNGLAVGSNASSSIAGALVVGSSGNMLTQVIGTTCNLIGADASQVASTTVPYDCAVTGLTSAFNVVAQLATSSTNGALTGTDIQNTWGVAGVSASSTSGYATVFITRFGATAVPSKTSVGSTTKIWAWKANNQ